MSNHNTNQLKENYMTYTSENYFNAMISAPNLELTIVNRAHNDVHHDPDRDDGSYVSEANTKAIVVGNGTVNVDTGDTDDFVFLGSGSGYLNLGGGTNFASIGDGSFTFTVDDETETTTLLNFDSANDKLRYHGGDRDAFEDAVVEGAAQFARGGSDDLVIEFNNTTILLEDFSGNLSSFVKTAAGEAALADFNVQGNLPVFSDHFDIF